MIHMLSALMEIMDDLQEQIGNMCRSGNSKKEPKGNQRNFFLKSKRTEVKNSFWGGPYHYSGNVWEKRIGNLEELSLEPSELKRKDKKRVKRQNRNPRALGQLKKV